MTNEELYYYFCKRADDRERMANDCRKNENIEGYNFSKGEAMGLRHCATMLVIQMQLKIDESACLSLKKRNLQ